MTGPTTGAGEDTVDPRRAVVDPARLAELHRARLLDTPAEPAFDRLAALAARLLRAPVALVSLVDQDRQFFKSCVGLAEPWRSARQTPLTHSFCQYAVARDQPLVVSDARLDPVLASNRATADMGVVAYAGVPIRSSGGQPLGSFCVIDSEARQWSDQDVGVLEELAAAVGDLIELRAGELLGVERRTALAEVVAAQEAERARIAADIHDDSLQVITAVSIRLQLLRRRADEATAETIDRLVATVHDASNRLRRLLFDLRPSVLDHEGLGAAIEAYLVNTCSEDDPAWVVRDDLGVELPLAARLVLFRISQQAVANAIAHARARGIHIAIEANADGVELTVTDDGVGFEPGAAGPQPGHLGLIAMRERAELAGGRLRIESRLGHGTAVRAWLPRGDD